MRQRHWLLLGGGLGLLLPPTPAQAQADSLAGIGQQFVRYAGRTPVEKLFMHLDRPAYVSGETMWLRLYVVEGTTQQPLPASTVAYVEVLGPTNAPVLQAKIPLHAAAGHGSLVLPPDLPTGRYTVRAYTSWMRNFGPDYFFRTVVTVVNTRQPAARRPVARLAPAASTAALDPRFFPEGGYLVQSLPSRVGFKLTDASGRGVAAEGTVLDATGATVAQFRTLWAGMGSFDFVPAQAGAAYRAVIRPAGQPAITCALPLVQPQGYGLHLEAADAGQLRVVVRARGPRASAGRLYVLGHAGQRVAVAAAVQLDGGQATLLLTRSQLPAGVTHFTLFDGQRRPVCERLYFTPPAATLSLSAQADKSQYVAREQATLQLAAAGRLPASCSVAVYQLDSLSAPAGPDITSYLWLAADLPGPVENPARYLEAGNPEATAATDNLLLTQGWSRFRWVDVLAPRPGLPPDSLAYAPELNGPLLRGRVLNRLTRVPVAKMPVYFASPSRRVQLYAAVSGAAGRFQVAAPDLYGPRLLIGQADLRLDSLGSVELFSAFAPPPVAGPTGPATALAPLALQPALTASLLRRHVQAEVGQRYGSGPPVRYAAPALDSAAFYGPPSERYLLDKYTRFKVMEEVMREYVPGVIVRLRKDGFHFLVPDYQNRETNENPLVLLDGVPVFDTNRIMAFDPLKVQRLDVLTTRYFLGPTLHNGLVSYSTYRGDLAGFEPDAHALLTQYEGLQGEREFYAPRYDTPAAAQSRQPDFRNLLYWNPAVVVPPGGSLSLPFYTSDQVGRYRVVVQGLTPDGRTGSTSLTLEVKAPL